MSIFQIHEIATMRYAKARPEYEGGECEVIGGLQMRAITQTPGKLALRYLIRTKDGNVFAAAPYNLLKKQPKVEPSTAAWIATLDLIDRVQSPNWVAA